MHPATLSCTLVLLLSAPVGAVTPEDSAVKVFATVRFPNPIAPWTNGNPTDVMGSGTIIDGQRILTNAHLVMYATDVQIQPRRGSSKIEAKVEIVAPDMDLAVLTVQDAKFFEKYPPLPRAKSLPKVQENVVVYGFPIGGNDLAVTKGVVSRIDYGRYYHQGLGLIVQVSAAINPGNSGGPAVVGDSMIGVVMSRLREQQNIGFIIPNQEIDHFLTSIQSGRYVGKPLEASGTEFQRCENKTLRSYLSIPDEAKGVLVIPPRRRPANYPFEEFDLLTKIGPYDIDNDGMVQLPNDLRVSFVSVLEKLAKNNSVPVTVVRKSRRIDSHLSVHTDDNRLIPGLRGERPAYFIHGPLVFSPARLDAYPWYLRLRPDLEDIQSPLFVRLWDRADFPGEELVVVTSPLFSHKIAKGYADPVGQVVTQVNGIQVKNLTHLVEILRDSTEEYLTFRFAEKGAEMLVFRRDEMAKVTDEILEDNGISPSRRGSEELLKTWKQTKAR